MRLPNVTSLINRLWRVFALAIVGLNVAYAQAAGPSTPLVQWFVSTPSSIASGASTTLRWNVDGADAVSVDQGIGTVPAAGSVAVSPTSTTTYTLTASNANGSVQKSRVVVVSANPTESGLRWVKMVGPSSGQRLTAPATLRVFAAAFDPAGAACGVDGTEDRCASRVDFYVDDTLMGQVPANQSEFWVFKTSFGGIGPGTHRVWARATYTNPAQTLDSEPSWITVDDAPAYAQTVDLTQDVVLSGAQDYELAGTAAGRIRLNGHGHRITSAADWNGRLTLKNVDLFDFGAAGDTTPSIDVTTGNGVVVEDSVFDTVGIVSLVLNGSATASVRRNEFRVNMRMPETQLPEFGDDSSYPAIRMTGSSTAQKFFQGNSIALGWADFRNADNWLIGGTEGEGNVVIAPRGGIWAQNMTRTVIRGNFVYHVYFGGWSQGNVMEIGGSHDLVVEHNVIGGGSWPIRGLEGGTLRYNIVLDAGHQWLWITGDDAVAHHNIFTGGDAEIAGIWTLDGPQGVEFYNNTIEGVGMSAIKPFVVSADTSALLHSNAFVNTVNPPAIEADGTLVADNNLFSGQQGTPKNYSDNRAPAHDVGGLNAQVDPHFVEPGEPWRYGFDDLWTRRVPVSQVLAKYRARYTPAPGSPLIDAGDRQFVAGNDIGAVGAGQPAADDLFGFADTIPPADSTPPTGTLAIDGGAATTDSPNVTLSLAATDDASGVAQMRFSNDGTSFALPVAFAATASWTLSGGNGPKTVFAEFRDGAGNWSAAVSASIVLDAPADTAPPAVAIGAPADGSTVSGTVTIAATASDNIGVASVTVLVDGTQLGSALASAPYSVPWNTASASNGSHVITATARDAAGNLATSSAVTVTVSNVVAAPPPGRLVAAYGFEEGTGSTAADASGDNLTGTVTGATWVDGKFGKALQFAGAFGSWVTVPDADALDLTNGMTVEAWVKPTAPMPQWPSVVMKERSGELTYALYANSASGNPNINYTSDGSEVTLEGQTGIPVNQWTHLAGIFDGTTMKLYVNGALVSSKATSAPIDVTDGVLRIGGDSVWSGEYFTGVIDEVRIYNRALAQSEVQADMGTPVVPAGPSRDPTAPTVSIDSPATGGTVSGTATIGATASDDVGVVGVRVLVDGTQVGAELTTAPYSVAWDTTTASNGDHAITAIARDAAGNSTTSVAVTVTVSNVVTTPPAPVGGLVAAYGFEEGAGSTANDASGGNHAGTVTGATWVDGKFGKALRFAGAFGSWVTIPDANALDLTNGMTVEAWIKPVAALATWPSIINKERSGELTYALYANSDSGHPNIDYTSGGSEVNLEGDSGIPVNQWTHLAGTFDGTALKLYVNGQLVSSKATTAPIDVTDGVLRIGGDGIWSGEYFTGVVDEVRVYNRALAQSEVRADMDAPVVAGTQPPAQGADTTPPGGTIVINGGDVTATQLDVTLSLTASDDATGVVQMRLSNDGITFTDPLPFAATAPWTLTPGDGTKTVSVQFRDGAGNWSDAFADTISFVTPVQLPPVPGGHPRILGAELARMQADFTAGRRAITRFKEGFVDPELQGADLYAFEEWHAALMGVATGQPQYCAFAVQGIDKFLDGEAKRITDGDVPAVVSDSYLGIGDIVGDIALVYDWCYSSLDATQKLRWGNYADRFVDNVWNQQTNHWGAATPANNYSWEGTPQDPGTGWAVDNPFNNYYYSFLRATMLWGLASKDEPGRTMADGFLQKFRGEKLQRQLAPEFEQSLQGGGSREGTGYGTSMGDLFGIYWFWEKTTGERIADLTSHTHASMTYEINAIAPSRDFLAPIGDQSRDSSAAFYDYHRKYLLALASLYKGTPMARTVRDWLAGSTRPEMGDGFNWVYDVLYDGTETVAPAVLSTSYYGPGTGHFFSRSGQEASATWLTYITGPYTESHAHQDGLSIMLFKNGWLVGDAGTLSHSGLQASQEAHALLTQTRPGETSPIDMIGLPADPTSVPPRPENSAHLRALAVRPLYTYASSDQGNLFVSPWDGDAGVREEREIVQIMPDVVVVFDRADYAAGTTIKRFQLPMAGRPVISGRTATYGNGVSTLTVHALQPAASALSVTHMPDIDSDFDDGYRLDSTVTTSGLTHFLDVLSVDGAVATATPGADAGSVTLTLSDGRTVALSFNLTGQGGTIEIRNSANEVLVSEPLPATIAPAPMLAGPN